VASVKIKPNVPATQHHHRKRPVPAHWRTISNVRFLFGLTTYICKEIRVKLDNKHWYDHAPKSVEMSHEGNVIIRWNQQVQTGRIIPNGNWTS
jgi:hypothetical protein